MMRRYAVALAVVAVAPLGAQGADRISYSYLDAQYLSTKVEATSGGTTTPGDKREGMRAGLDISLAPYLFFVADYDQRLLQGTRWSYASTGFGAHTMAREYQLFGIATYEHNLLHKRGDSTQDDRGDGYGLEAGARVPWNILEVHAAYKYFDLGQTEFADGYKTTGSRYGGGVLVQVTPWLALTGDWRHLEHKAKGDGATSPDFTFGFDEWLVGFRSYFATDVDKYRRHEGIFGTDEGNSAE